ncbi:alpha,alpha-trehalose-phosphate synthase (UDP-forming) [Methanomassiliicoccus luminyensis]|uniref:alpha,alpha-trehalose-phosphate synthase (UDP-forming) n=1 Tax=Methanomassiliicoccus luminyensis TaxID=1080712 RepID=UPI0009D988E7|nr:trehalose-6-phosphate synthase [Methanomassiliicoccus luminyensis]
MSGSGKLVLISNREPYVHERTKKGVKCKVPPGGVVTAIDPVMQATGGTWIAWGSGNADMEVSDPRGRIAVPPEDPKYTLRRVWLSTKEVADYYLGFSNRVLWPICHMFQENAQFNKSYWEAYKRVNEKFAAAAVEEMDQGSNVWVQDVHFSLVPSMIRAKVPDASIAMFWHIPFPAVETFACIPWRNEILKGLLDADLIGFHTHAYAGNFLSTVRREFPDASVTDDAIELDGHVTKVRAIPIGIDFGTYRAKGEEEVVHKRAAKLRRKMDVERVLLGVDRLDYTKGILNRFLAFERFLDSNPKYMGKVSFVQVASPSRSLIHEYREMKRQVEETVGRINGRFQTPNWTPIVYINRHIPSDELLVLYELADVAMVTPVIDGMNLVAKEYVTVNDQGALILSEFAGASEEMKDALIVNPYDVEMTSRAILSALTMPEEERTRHIDSLRSVVREHDIYWWLDTFFQEWGMDLKSSRPRNGTE